MKILRLSAAELDPTVKSRIRDSVQRADQTLADDPAALSEAFRRRQELERGGEPEATEVPTADEATTEIPVEGRRARLEQAAHPIQDTAPNSPEAQSTKFYEMNQRDARVATEALRVLDSLTPDQEAAWMSAFYPEYDVPKIDQLKSLVTLQNPREQDLCLEEITAVIGEKPQFAELMKINEEDPDAELDFAEEPTAQVAEDVIGAGVQTPSAAPAVAPTTPTTPSQMNLQLASRKVTLTKESWLAIGKQTKWI